MTVGDTAQLTYAILPAYISVSLSWYSNKTSVATVSSSGLVTAVGTGTVTITLTAASTSPLGGSISDTVTLYVHDDTGIKSNTAYYIMNAESGRFLSLETTSDANKASEYQEVMGSMGYASNNWHCTTAVWAYGALANTNDIFTFVGHGFEPLNVPRAGISFQTDSGGDNGDITAQPFGSSDKRRAISDLDDNSLALSRCVLYLGCNAGATYTINGESSNLVEETFRKGAHFVLAPTQTILDGEAYAFLDDFLSNCSTENIYDSIKGTIIESPIFEAHYLGDTKQFLCIP